MRSGAHWFLMVRPNSSVFEETIHFGDQRKECLGALPGRGLVREAVPDLALFLFASGLLLGLRKRTD
jgi:hypothetical protein